MNWQNKYKNQKKQYTNIRLLTKLHKHVKSIAENEQRNLDVVTNRLMAYALEKIYDVKIPNSDLKTRNNGDDQDTSNQ